MIITTEELSQLAWETIQQELNPETRKILKSMSYTSPEFEQGFIQGLAWLSILAVGIRLKETKEDDSQRVVAALEDESYFNKETEEAYNKNINNLYKSLNLNVYEILAGVKNEDKEA